MLSKKSQEKLLKLFKLSEDEITTLLSDEEKEFEIPNVTVLDEEGKSQLLENHVKANKTALREILIKDMKSLAGLDFEGKTPEKFIESFKEQILKDANIGTDEKVKAKEAMITELRSKLEAKDVEINSFNSKLSQIENDTLLLRNMPKDRDSRLTDDDYLTLIRNKAKIVKDEDGTTSFEFNGKKVTDDKLNPLPLNVAMENVFKESNWMKQEDTKDKAKGVGFGDNKKVPNAINTLTDFEAWCKSNGHNINGVEAQNKLLEVTKANPNFVFN